ncbi:hypothetical protein ATCC90586_008636 [Pythium insidiosum]|nr:hypothetical protein ATCC90586_008636 [Pythium insidiosum]
MSWLKSKIRMVAARASDALAQAADLMAPTLYESRVEELHHRWTTVSRFLESVLLRELDAGEQRRLLAESHTRESLQKIVVLIVTEESDTDRHALQRQAQAQAHAHHNNGDPPHEPSRQCLEYLLDRQLLPLLCDAGRRDQPCGIMSLAMQFVAALLSRVSYPLLPTREIHESVVALLQSASRKEVEDPVVRKSLVNLLHVIWKKLRADPIQTEFFFARSLPSPSSPHPAIVSELVIFTALLPHMDAVGKVGERCREAMVIAAGLQEPTLARFVLELTPFCHYAVNGVISAFDALPKTLPERYQRAGGSPHGGKSSSSASLHRGLDTDLETLALRLRFCCTLAMVGRLEIESGDWTQRSISNEVLTQFRTRFLSAVLQESLMDTSEATARTATLYARIILEDLAACGADTSTNPLLQVFIQFLIGPHDVDACGRQREDAESAPRRLPLELMHRMDSLSSSLSIATMDLFTSLLELQNDLIDATLLGGDAITRFQELRAPGARRRSSAAASAILSPRSDNGSVSPYSGAIWFACRFPESAVAANAHVWKIQAFDSLGIDADIPSSALSDSDTSEDQIVSLLSYIADAEFVTCQRAPAVVDDWESSDDEDEDDAAPIANSDPGSFSHAQAVERLSALSNQGNPEQEQDHSAFMRLILNRLERILESSFYENLALSGLISVLAQKDCCARLVFDVAEQLGAGGSVRAIRHKLVEENNESSLNDHEPETRLLCGE